VHRQPLGGRLMSAVGEAQWKPDMTTRELRAFLESLAPVSWSKFTGKTVRLRGQTMDVRYTAAFAYAVGRSYPTVMRWERECLIPRPPLVLNRRSRHEARRRAWPDFVLDQIAAAAETHGVRSGGPPTERFYVALDRIYENWRAALRPPSTVED
jgi:hypothetical protein